MTFFRYQWAGILMCVFALCQEGWASDKVDTNKQNFSKTKGMWQGKIQNKPSAGGLRSLVKPPVPRNPHFKPVRPPVAKTTDSRLPLHAISQTTKTPFQYKEVKTETFTRKSGLEKESSITKETPLDIAVSDNNLKEVRTLLKMGANPNHLPADKIPPIGSAFNNKNQVMVSLLLEYGANPNALRGSILTPLREAVRLKMDKTIEPLIKAGAHLEVKELPGLNLEYASFNTFKTLIKAGASYADVDDIITLDPSSENNKQKKEFRKKVLSSVIYPEDPRANKERSPYSYLNANNEGIQDFQKGEPFIAQTAAAQSLRVLMGQSGGVYGMSKKQATLDQAKIMVRSIGQVAKIGNDLALLNLLNSGNEGKTDQFKKHKLAVYLLYRHARKEDPKLEEVRNLHLDGLTRDRLEQYSRIAVTKYGAYLSEKDNIIL